MEIVRSSREKGAGISSGRGRRSTPAALSRELISISFDAMSVSQTRSPIPSVAHSLPITSHDGKGTLVAAQSDCFPQTLPSSWPSLSLGRLHATRSPDEGDSQRRLLHVSALNTPSASMRSLKRETKALPKFGLSPCSPPERQSW